MLNLVQPSLPSEIRIIYRGERGGGCEEEKKMDVRCIRKAKPQCRRPDNPKLA